MQKIGFKMFGTKLSCTSIKKVLTVRAWVCEVCYINGEIVSDEINLAFLPLSYWTAVTIKFIKIPSKQQKILLKNSHDVEKVIIGRQTCKSILHYCFVIDFHFKYTVWWWFIPYLNLFVLSFQLIIMSVNKLEYKCISEQYQTQALSANLIDNELAHIVAIVTLWVSFLIYFVTLIQKYMFP